MKTLKLSSIMHQINSGNSTGNKISIFKKMAFLAFFSLLVAGQVSAQLSGTYTIDSSKAASKTNYKNFHSAIADLDSGVRFDGGTVNGPGISSWVEFDVANGTYTEKNTITPIPGSSVKNYVVFRSYSGDSSKVILNWTFSNLPSAESYRTDA